MNKIFIRIDKDNNVSFIHYKPFDERQGLKKTIEELEQTGYLVDSINEAESIPGKIPMLKFDPDTNTLYYEYVDLPEEPNTNNSQNQLDEIQEVLNILLGED